jgi:hypothetical protein
MSIWAHSSYYCAIVEQSTGKTCGLFSIGFVAVQYPPIPDLQPAVVEIGQG